MILRAQTDLHTTLDDPHCPGREINHEDKVRPELVTGFVCQHIVERELLDLSVNHFTECPSPLEPVTCGNCPRYSDDRAAIVFVEIQCADHRDCDDIASAWVHVRKLKEERQSRRLARDRQAGEPHEGEARDKCNEQCLSKRPVPQFANPNLKSPPPRGTGLGYLYRAPLGAPCQGMSWGVIKAWTPQEAGKREMCRATCAAWLHGERRSARK